MEPESERERGVRLGEREEMEEKKVEPGEEREGYINSPGSGR